jgi:hypothetical protein
MILLLAALLIAPAAAEAACKSKDIGGKWYFYMTTNDDAEFWHRCVVKLTNAGEIDGKGSICKSSSGNNRSITDGKLTVKKSCLVKGNLLVDGVTSTFDHAWMTLNTESFSGVGHTPTTTFAYTFVRD